MLPDSLIDDSAISGTAERRYASSEPVVAMNEKRSILSLIPMTVFWALAAQAISSVMRLLTSVTVGGRFGSGSEEQLGYYSSAFGVLMIVVGIHEAFVTTPLTVFNQKRSDDQRKPFSGNMLIASLLVIGLIATVASIFVAIQFGFEVLKPELGFAFIAVAALAPLQLGREFSRRWLLANLAVKASALLECFFAAIYLVVLIALVYAAKISAIAVFISIGCVNFVGLAIWWSIYRSDFRFDRSSTRSQITENFRYGRWVAGENVCSTLTMYMCVWFLTYKIDASAAGVFFACFTIVMLANPLLLGISSILAPRAAQEYVNHSWSGLIRILSKYGLFTLSVLAVFAGCLWFWGEPLTELFFSKKYALYFEEHFGGKNSITSILGIAMPLLGMSFVFTIGLLAASRPQDSFIAALVGLTTLMIANFSFAQPNLKTAAVSFVVAVAVATLCRFIFLARAYRNGKPNANPPAAA